MRSAVPDPSCWPRPCGQDQPGIDADHHLVVAPGAAGPDHPAGESAPDSPAVPSSRPVVPASDPEDHPLAPVEVAPVVAGESAAGAAAELAAVGAQQYPVEWAAELDTAAVPGSPAEEAAGRLVVAVAVDALFPPCVHCVVEEEKSDLLSRLSHTVPFLSICPVPERGCVAHYAL